MNYLLTSDAISKWTKDGVMWHFTGQFLTAVLTTITICTICIVYNTKVKNKDDSKKLSGFIVLIDMFVGGCESIVVSTLGSKYRKLTPYAMYLFSYIFINALFSILGFEPATSSFTVTLSMGIVTFLGIYYFGLKYQKLAFFKKFLNPLEIVTQFVPLISISFRLFGNMLAGSIVLGLLYAMLIGIEAGFAGGSSTSIFNHTTNGQQDYSAQFTYWWSGFNLLTAVCLPWLHLYFDLFDGLIQAVVFMMLTLSYWTEAMGEEEEHSANEKHFKKLEKKLLKKEKKEKKLEEAVAL